MMQRYTVHFSGRVQGVGFRYTTVNLAANYDGLSGQVRNLADGRVQLIVEGSDVAVQSLIRDIQRQMFRNIKHTVVDTSPAMGDLGDGVTVGY